MLKKGFYLIFLLTLSTVVAIAQPEGDLPVEGDDGAKEAAERAAYLINFHNYNAALNSDLGTKKIFHHHIDINRTGASIPEVGMVTESIDCYFVYKEDEFVVKKFLVLKNNGRLSSTKEFTFDAKEDGELSYYSYNQDLNDPESEKKGFYFQSKQLIYYSENGIVQPKNGYGDDIFKQGIDVLNMAEDFRLMLNTLIRIQAK
ncbi:MAG: hypothetical protein ACI97N_001002 [Cognaticolwellia sp.]|jgi:hypothetical protein